ncbi:SCO family protein [Lysobacter panacisoli]|uniref:SCO family protein n=1 Tax=Lysobacter panacisoli TaxID=1255263 RepID=A0ABP9L8A8_9GAMM
MRRVLQGFLLSLSLLLAATATAGPALPGDSVYNLPASMTDQSGRVLAWQDLRGKPVVVSMFYTNCHLMCPLIIASGKALQKQLPQDQQSALDFAVVSIDPARDTPAALAEVSQQHRLDNARWHLLRPEARDVRTLASALGVRYRAQPDGSFNHTSVLILLDRDGRIVARSEVDGLQPDPAFVSTVREHLAAPN